MTLISYTTAMAEVGVKGWARPIALHGAWQMLRAMHVISENEHGARHLQGGIHD